MKKTYLCLMVLAVLLVPSLSRADDVPEVVKLYRKNRDTRAGNVFREDVLKVIRAAEKAEAAGNEQEALDLFHRALNMQQTPALELEYGFALLRAGKYLEASRYLTLAKRTEHVLHNFTQYPVSDIDAGLREVGKHLGMLMVHVNVPDARVMVDNEVIADFPYLSEIYVLPGHHEINATRAGFWMGMTEVDIKEGQSKAVRLGLQPAMDQQILVMPARMAMSIRDSATAAMEESTPSPWLTYFMVGSGVVMVTGLGLSLVGLDQGSSATTQEDKNTWGSVRTSGIIVGCVGLAGLVGGGVILANRPGPAPIRPVTLAPTVGKNSGGLIVQGTF